MSVSSESWTGGQYSVLRALLGAYLFVHFAHLVPWGAEIWSSAGVLPDAALSPLMRAFPNILGLADGPGFVTGLLVLTAGASLAFAAGAKDRWAAVFLWYVLACLYGRNPLTANPSLPYIGWMLLMHAAVAGTPFGAWSARGRPDPGAAWRLPKPLWVGAWVVLAVGYTYSGVIKLGSPSWIDGTALVHVLENPLARPSAVREALLLLPTPVLALATWAALGLEVLFAPLALFRRLRPWVWGTALAMHLSLIVLIDFADLTVGMLLIHALTFDPRWVPARGVGSAPLRVLYDGACGLCHGTVRFLLAEDGRGDCFVFAPLGGDTHRAVDGDVDASALVVVDHDGTLLRGADAVRRCLERMGGAWGLAGRALGWVPRHVRDAGYAQVARVRRRLLPAPASACPIVPSELRGRFLG